MLKLMIVVQMLLGRGCANVETRGARNGSDGSHSPRNSRQCSRRRATNTEIIVQEVIHFFRKCTGSTGQMMLKINMKNAFDILE